RCEPIHGALPLRPSMAFEVPGKVPRRLLFENGAGSVNCKISRHLRLLEKESLSTLKANCKAKSATICHIVATRQ
ncbi:MAG: hypothetical protein V4603_17495, partial [Pseudomonadota bacterium]